MGKILPSPYSVGFQGWEGEKTFNRSEHMGGDTKNVKGSFKKESVIDRGGYSKKEKRGQKGGKISSKGR